MVSGKHIHSFKAKYVILSVLLFQRKSTLLKLLRGEIIPTSGELIRNRFVRVGNFDQHSGDQFDLELTPVDHLRVRIIFSLI